jgi:hypothetical protein
MTQDESLISEDQSGMLFSPPILAAAMSAMYLSRSPSFLFFAISTSFLVALGP